LLSPIRAPGIVFPEPTRILDSLNSNSGAESGMQIDQPGVSFPRDSSWGAQSSAAGSNGGTSQAPPSELASKDMLRQRRASNPRETAWKQSPDTSFD
jgi:hypothetical protein